MKDDTIALELESINPDVRSALLFALWHHQGSYSKIGQSIRHALEIQPYEAMSDEQLSRAKRVQAALHAPQQPEPGFTGMSVKCDFETDTWSFKMDPGYRVSGGQYLITRIKAAPKFTS